MYVTVHHGGRGHVTNEGLSTKEYSAESNEQPRRRSETKEPTHREGWNGLDDTPHISSVFETTRDKAKYLGPLYHAADPFGRIR